MQNVEEKAYFHQIVLAEQQHFLKIYSRSAQPG